MKTTDEIAGIIRALLMKTVENGATEAEAMMAAAKAHELLTKYQLSMSDVEADPIQMSRAGASKRGPVSVAQMLAGAVGAYCDCLPWSARGTPMFTGRESNILFANWLLDALDGFCARRILEYAATLPMGANRTRAMADFKSGIAMNISKRLLAEVEARPLSERQKSAEANLAIITKNGVSLRKTRSKRIKMTMQNAFIAGQAAGQTATFSRPVNAGRGVHQIAS